MWSKKTDHPRTCKCLITMVNKSKWPKWLNCGSDPNHLLLTGYLWLFALFFWGWNIIQWKNIGIISEAMKFQDPSIWTNQDLMGAKGSTLPFSTGHRFPHLFGQWRPQTDGDRSHERFQEITEKTYQKTQPTKKPHKIPGSWQRHSCSLHFWLICWCTPPEIEHIDTVRTKNGHISKESTFSKPSTTHAKPLHPTPATLVGQGTEIFQGPSSWVSSCWFSGMQSRCFLPVVLGCPRKLVNG